jgi:hypothetical protein
VEGKEQRMNRKLLRVLDEIDKAEAKISEWQGHLAGLHEQRVQLEEKEIIKAVRAMGLTSRELAAAVDGLCTGKLALTETAGIGGGGSAVGGSMPGKVSGADASAPDGDGVSLAVETGNSPDKGEDLQGRDL